MARSPHATRSILPNSAITADDTVTASSNAELEDELRPPQRLAVHLACFEGLTNTEIAARLEIPLGTVKGRLRRGREKLEVALSAVGYTSLASLA